MRQRRKALERTLRLTSCTGDEDRLDMGGELEVVCWLNHRACWDAILWNLRQSMYMHRTFSTNAMTFG